MQEPSRQPDAEDDFTGLRCPKCDYDLKGLVSLECPECGQALCIADLRQAQRYSNKSLEWIARTLFLANGVFFAGLIGIAILTLTADWLGSSDSRFSMEMARIVPAAASLVVFGLVVSVPVAIITLIVAIMCENDRATFYCVFSILISIIAGGLCMFTFAGAWS